jgi:hypothetical protein
MEEKQYRITLDANVNVNQSGVGNTGVMQGATPSPINGGSISTPQRSSLGVGGAISAQMLVEQTTRLIGATGNQEVAQMVSTTSRYAFLGMRAISGDITAQITLAVSLSTLALQEVRKQAEFNNETDNARARAGLTNMEGVKVTKNWITGRQTYTRG